MFPQQGVRLYREGARCPRISRIRPRRPPPSTSTSTSIVIKFEIRLSWIHRVRVVILVQIKYIVGNQPIRDRQSYHFLEWLRFRMFQFWHSSVHRRVLYFRHPLHHFIRNPTTFRVTGPMVMVGIVNLRKKNCKLIRTWQKNNLFNTPLDPCISQNEGFHLYWGEYICEIVPRKMFPPGW